MQAAELPRAGLLCVVEDGTQMRLEPTEDGRVALVLESGEKRADVRLVLAAGGLRRLSELMNEAVRLSPLMHW